MRRYLHAVVQRECDERLENRTAEMLRQSRLSLEMFDTIGKNRLKAVAVEHNI